MAKVSVIVPVYNTEKYLRRCIDSLVGQTIDDIEVVLVNDGSTDGSLTILEEYKERYPDRVLLINKENGGQATARNLGMRQCHGEYIGFVDSDDMVDLNMFKTLYDEAVKHNNDLTECHYHYVLEEEDGLKELKTRGHIRQYKNQKDMFINPMASPWNKLYKRELLLENDITFPEGMIYEDTSFFIKTIPYVKKSTYVDEKFVYYYLRGNSTMNANKSKKVGDIFKVIEDYIEFYKKRGFFEKYKVEMEYFTVKILLCSSLSRIGRVSDKKLERAFRKKTFDIIERDFPNYKKNPYFTGKIGMYIRFVGRKNSKIIGKVLGKVMKG